MGLPYPHSYHGRWTNGNEGEYAGWGFIPGGGERRGNLRIGSAGGGAAYAIDRSDEGKLEEKKTDTQQ